MIVYLKKNNSFYCKKKLFFLIFFLSFSTHHSFATENSFYSFNKQISNFVSVHYQTSYGNQNYNNLYDYNKINFSFFSSPINNVNLYFNIPFVFVYDHQKKNNIENSGTIGDVDFNLRFLFKDREYQFYYSLVIGYKIPLASSFNQRRLNKKLDDTLKKISVSDFYPLANGNEEMLLGLEIEKKLFLNFFLSFYYVYEMSASEGDIANFFSLNNNNKQFSLLGIEKIFQRLFYNPNLEDPWVDKLNDHFQFLFFLQKKIRVKNFFNNNQEWQFIPFTAIKIIKRFTEFSFHKSVTKLSIGYSHFIYPFTIPFFYQINFVLPFFFEESYEYRYQINLSFFLKL